MLVLTRKIGEIMMINNGETQVAVLSVKGNAVRLGITAPMHIAVDRKEIFLRKQAELTLNETNNIHP